MKHRSTGHHGCKARTAAACPSIHVYYLTGPVFFGSVTTVLESFQTAGDYHTLIVSMRGVPMIDVMGAQALRQIVEEQHRRGGEVYFSALQPAVRVMFDRAGLTKLIGTDHMFWSSAQAIIALHDRRKNNGCPRCDAQGDGCAVLQTAHERIGQT